MIAPISPTGDGNLLPAGSAGGGGGIQAVSSLNRLRNSRSASTGSSGSVISNGGRVSRTASSGMEQRMSFDPQHGVVGLGHAGRLVLRKSKPHRDRTPPRGTPRIPATASTGAAGQPGRLRWHRGAGPRGRARADRVG